MIQGHAAIVFTLPSLFLMIVIFMTQLLRRSARQIGLVKLATRAGPNLRLRISDLGPRSSHLRLSTTTSTSQGRSVPFFFSSSVFLDFMRFSFRGRLRAMVVGGLPAS